MPSNRAPLTLYNTLYISHNLTYNNTKTYFMYKNLPEVRHIKP